MDVGVTPRIRFPFTILNIFLFPAPVDVDMSEGLCGTINSNPMDDLTHKDGTTTPVDYGWWWWPWWQTTDPVSFIDSWRVSTADSLWKSDLQTDDLADYNDDTMCVCTGSEGTGTVLCSTQERRLCLQQGYYSGAEITRRSAESHMSRRRKEREIQGHMMDRRQIESRLKIRAERRSHITTGRTKRNAVSSITFADALALCRSAMSNNCGNLVLSSNVEVTGNLTIQEVVCAHDKMVNSSVNWEDSACAAAITATANRIERNISLDSLLTESEKKNLCPNFCNGAGTCSDDGVCQCDAGYDDDDCGLPLSFTVELTYTSGELCSAPCQSIQLVANRLGDTAMLRYRTKRIYLPANTNNGYGSYAYSTPEIYNQFEANFIVPSNRKRRSTSSGTSEAAVIYDISASNDGSTYGGSVPVIVLDSTCLSYTGSGDNITITLTANYCLIDGLCYQNGVNYTGQTCQYCNVAADVYGWTLNSDYCLIDGVCYANGTTKSGNTCKFCHVTLDSSSWTDDNETASCQTTDTGGIKGHVIAIIVVVVILALVGIAVISYFLWKKHQKSKRTGSGLFESVANSKFTLRVEPLKSELVDPENSTPPKPNGNRWNIGNGQQATPRKPKFLLQSEPSTLGLLDDPENQGAARWINGRGVCDSAGRTRFVSPHNLNTTADHPPPVTYPLYEYPEPGTEYVPSNLYTEREGSDTTPVPAPIGPTRELSGHISTGHITPQSDADRAHTPSMPNIE